MGLRKKIPRDVRVQKLGVGRYLAGATVSEGRGRRTRKAKSQPVQGSMVWGGAVLSLGGMPVAERIEGGRPAGRPAPSIEFVGLV